MVRELRTNTAVIVTVGPFLDVSDGATIETGLTITNEKITLVADANDGSEPSIILDNVSGSTSGTDNDLNYITDCDAGLMQLELTAANINLLGHLTLTITDAANHMPVVHEFNVVSAQYFDAKYGTGNFSADCLAISGDSVAADNLEASCDGTSYNIGGGAITIVSPFTGTGLLEVTYALTLSDNGLPISNARVWVSTDSSHSNIVASSVTDAFGVATFNLDPGTYYLWRYKSGVNFTNPLQGTFSVNNTSASGTGTLTNTMSTARIKTVTYVSSV